MGTHAQTSMNAKSERTTAVLSLLAPTHTADSRARARLDIAEMVTVAMTPMNARAQMIAT